MRGNLVFRKTPDGDEYGIVTDCRGGKLLVLMGDGLCVESPATEWRDVLFHGSIVSSFPQLIPVYEYISPDDLRVKFQELKDKFDNLEDTQIGADHDATLAERVNRIEALPRMSWTGYAEGLNKGT